MSAGVGNPGKHRVRVIFECGGHEHEMCYSIGREVHPDLRCTPAQGDGYSQGGGGCVLPPDLDARIERELRGGGLQEARRRGHVRIAA